MPAEQAQMGEEETLTDKPGTPSMAEGIQVAGPMDAAIRKLITRQGTKAERNLVPEAARLAPGEMPDAAKAGRFKLIPEADQTLTDTVGAAVSRRQTYGITQGKPGGTPDEPFNLARYQTEDAAGIVAGVADALNIRTKAVTFDEIKAKAAESGIGESFLTRLIGSDGKMMANAVETYKALEVLETSANELDKLFKLVNSGMATDADKLMLRQQVAFHGMIQKGVKGIQTERRWRIARHGPQLPVPGVTRCSECHDREVDDVWREGCLVHHFHQRPAVLTCVARQEHCVQHHVWSVPNPRAHGRGHVRQRAANRRAQLEVSGARL